MTRKSLGTAWTTIGLFVVFTSLNGLLISQGVGSLVGSLDLSTLKSSGATPLTLAITIPSYFILGYLTVYYQNQYPACLRWASLPAAFNLEIDSRTPLGRNYQRFFLIIFLIFPLYCQSHLLGKLISKSVFDNDTGQKVSDGSASVLFDLTIALKAFSGDFRFGSSDGVTYFPVIETWFFILAFSISAFILFRVLYRIIRFAGPDKILR